MKKILAAVLMTGLFAGTALAAATANPGDGVVNSVHDMNVLNGLGLGQITPDAQGRVCAFCHTPHHALSDVKADYAPLWSHNFTQMVGYDGYASATFDAGNAATIDSLYGPSRLCMSCHDGVISADQHYGSANGAVGGLMASDDFNGKAIGLNNKFGNDHPIGFDVETITAGANMDLGIDAAIVGAKEWKGNPGKKVVNAFYVPVSGTGKYMTCATCHDVHNKDNAKNDATGNLGDGLHNNTLGLNYLVYSPQSGSQLCVTCHLK